MSVLFGTSQLNFGQQGQKLGQCFAFLNAWLATSSSMTDGEVVMTTDLTLERQG